MCVQNRTVKITRWMQSIVRRAQVSLWQFAQVLYHPLQYCLPSGISSTLLYIHTYLLDESDVHHQSLAVLILRCNFFPCKHKCRMPSVSCRTASSSWILCNETQLYVHMLEALGTRSPIHIILGSLTLKFTLKRVFSTASCAVKSDILTRNAHGLP